MTQFILHIGLHKTGTSTIQSFLSDRRGDLLERGIDFPLHGRTAKGSQSHRHVAAWFREQDEEYPPEFAGIMEHGLSTAPRCILSAEDLYFCQPDSIERIAATFGPQTHVICYLRDPVSHVLSMYKERLKRPAEDSLPAFVELHRQALAAGSPRSYYAFARNLGYWQQHFRVTAAPYLRQGLVRDFIGRCEVDLPDELLREEPRENVSVSEEALMLQLAAGRALLDGLITTDQWRRLKARIVRGDREGDLPSIEKKRRMIELDFRPFLDQFRMANPGFEDYAAQSPERMTVWDSDSLNHVGLLKQLRRHFGMKRRFRTQPE